MYSDEIEKPDGRRARQRERGSSSFGWKSIVIFIGVLGVAFGIVLGIVPFEKLKEFFGASNGSDSGEGSTSAPTTAPIELLTCDDVSGECCNGLPSNCDLRASELFWPTVHNANHDDLLGNNRAPLEDALAAGYRGLLLDVCSCPNEDDTALEIVFCHGFCAVGRRSFEEVFTNINTFLDNNPTETIMINFEISVGDPPPTPSEIWTDIIKYTTALKTKTYIHGSKTEFPTMRELQAAGRQLILFKHNGINCYDTGSNGCIGRILEFHKYAQETDYDFSSVEEIETYSVSCPGTRGTSSTNDFYAINHFVTKWHGPSLDSAQKINTKSAVQARIAACERRTKLDVNVVAIDFWQEGGLLQVAQEINQARAKRRRSLTQRILGWIMN